MTDTASQPINLTVVVPAMGAVEPHAFDHPGGYRVMNLSLPVGVSYDPVHAVATALLADGYSPHTSFALTGPLGETLFIGNINDHCRPERRAPKLETSTRENSGPARLHVIVPANAVVSTGRRELLEGGDYVVCNLPGVSATANPVKDVARALADKGHSPFISFAIVDDGGRTLYVGNMQEAFGRVPRTPEDQASATLWDRDDWGQAAWARGINDDKIGLPK